MTPRIDALQNHQTLPPAIISDVTVRIIVRLL